MHLVVPQPKTQALLLLRDGLRDGRARPRAHDAAANGALPRRPPRAARPRGPLLRHHSVSTVDEGRPSAR